MKTFDKYNTRGADYHYSQINGRSIRTYNAFVDARFKKVVSEVRNIVVEFFTKYDTIKILDVGCGDGVALHLIRKALPNFKLDLYGVDPAEVAINVARAKNPDMSFTQSDAYHLPFPENTFDIVISTDVIEHLDTPLVMLGEIKRVAKQDASIIVGTPIKRTKSPIDPQHVEEFFPEDFTNMMSQFFRECELHETHNLIPTLLYNAPTKSFLNFKYILNLISIIFHFNPFLKKRSNSSQMFAYMYTICKK